MPVMFQDLSERLGSALKSLGWMLATAESCTAGGLAAAVTLTPGSSQWFERGFITYSNLSKIEMLGISPEILKNYGAVSEVTAEAMVLGALAHSHANIVLSVTGIAGPDGGAPSKPVGTVWFGMGCREGRIEARRRYFAGSREEIRHASVEYSLRWLLSSLA